VPHTVWVLGGGFCVVDCDSAKLTSMLSRAACLLLLAAYRAPQMDV
jgi:hypothetical protein